MIFYILQYIAILMLAVVVHEFGHVIAASIFGVRIKTFGIGFGKPYIHKKIFAIDFRLSPWLIGGFVSMAGEEDKRPNGFLAQPYHKKAIILLAGIVMNLILACICYWINYKSISYGLGVDISLIKSMCIKDYVSIYEFMISDNLPNLFLLKLSCINLFCAGFNLIPFTVLDGSLLWIVGLEKLMPIKRFIKMLKYLRWFGLVVLLL